MSGLGLGKQTWVYEHMEIYTGITGYIRGDRNVVHGSGKTYKHGKEEPEPRRMNMDGGVRHRPISTVFVCNTVVCTSVCMCVP